jgi:hypothetical protein
MIVPGNSPKRGIHGASFQAAQTRCFEFLQAHANNLPPKSALASIDPLPVGRVDAGFVLEGEQVAQFEFLGGFQKIAPFLIVPRRGCPSRNGQDSAVAPTRLTCRTLPVREILKGLHHSGNARQENSSIPTGLHPWPDPKTMQPRWVDDFCAHQPRVARELATLG